ncbi:MAG: hypothetical protein R2747_07810 [Pyrinomonadaceae bacterium]
MKIGKTAHICLPKNYLAESSGKKVKRFEARLPSGILTETEPKFPGRAKKNACKAGNLRVKVSPQRRFFFAPFSGRMFSKKNDWKNNCQFEMNFEKKKKFWIKFEKR